MEEGQDLQGWEARETLLAAAADAGSPLTGSQLSRLHRSDLIARPRTRSLGRGLGKQSLYPPGTTDRLLRVLEVRREVRGFDDVAWRLWWEDGGYTLEAVRARLRRVAEEWEAFREGLAELLAGEDASVGEAEAEMEAAYRSLETDRMSPGLELMRRNVGRADFPSVFRVLAEVWSGRFLGYGEVAGEGEVGRGELLEQAFGIDRARVDGIDGSEPWFEGSSEDDMLKLSALTSTRALVEIADADEAELDAARAELRAFVHTILPVTAVVSGTFGSAAFGSGTANAVFRDWSADDEAIVLLVWSVLRSDEQLREGMSAHGAPRAEAAELQTLYEGMVEWREEIPAYAQVFADESLAAALRNPEARAQLNEELRRLYLDHGLEVDRFVAQRPELERAMATFE